MATTSVSPPYTGAPEKKHGITQGLMAMLFFVGSEVMLFASFFTAYFFIRYAVDHPVWPPLNQNGEPFELPVAITAVNTAILVASSFVLWWGEKRFAEGDRQGLIRGLWLTILMGGTFLIIQLNEYAHLGFTPQDTAFSGAFYSLTGLHGLHVLVGLIVLSLCLRRVYAADFTPTNHTPLAAGSVYWHFVDVVWVLLFILVYLI
ncbi:MAG: cytochrome c oxidase subunit 3 [Thermoleophilia bacterium]|jgi:cytochrome c oxidase subunit 3|nr:cytochrome c oxidase subunit 3 [Thermoleophilia bacterium]